MILRALCDYYDSMVKKGVAAKEGYTPNLKIHYLVCLNEDGSVDEILSEGFPSKENPKKTDYPVYTFPARTQKPGIDSNIVEHRPLYLFGLNYDKETQSFTTEDATNKAKKSHADFVKKNLEFFEGLSSPLCKAYYRFIQRWNPEGEEEKSILLNSVGKEYPTSNFAFCLSGFPSKLLQEEEEVQTKWEKLLESKETEGDDLFTICPVYGEVLPTARLHDKIKGIKGGNSTGSTFICFNNESENSYGKEQAYNSGISLRAMKKYTEALNYLLKSSKHHSYLESMTLVYFALDDNEEVEEDKCLDFFQLMAFGNEEKTSSEVEENLSATVKGISAGNKNDFSYYDDIPENIRFYLFAFTPNSSRVAVKMAYSDTFGSLKKNLMRYHEEYKIGDLTKAPPLWRVLKQLLSPKSQKEEVPPGLAERLLNSILTGTRFPTQLLTTLVRRIKTDSDEEKNHFIKMNDTRIGLLKAILNRNYKENLKMALDTQNTKPAYLCGRLFAVLEKIQKDALPSINRTIKDSYFSSAAATPAFVFNRLMKLSQAHLSKLSEGGVVYYNKLMGEIISELSEFPKTLSQEEQSLFIVGYYHQNKAFYQKNNQSEEN